MKKRRRQIDTVVISDVHLGTYGCKATELLKYLKSVRPKTLILNGDIIDIWQFSKRYFPKSHMKVIKYIFGLLSKGVNVYYVTGNHDELLRKFEGFELGQLKLVNQVILELEDGKKAWVFHGDVFDVTMKHSRWVAKLGAIGYDTLILLNALVNLLSRSLGRGRISLSKKIKDKVKGAVSFINNFEETAASIAVDKGYDYVVCGHIHQPAIKDIAVQEKTMKYLNSGDWIENLTALEYNEGEWSLYHYEDIATTNIEEPDEDLLDKSTKELFSMLAMEFQVEA